MFTGIVECTGTVERIEDLPGLRRLTVHAPSIAAGLQIGSSVSVDGCCLTVTRVIESDMQFELMQITLDRTRLGTVGVGDRVNLERSLKIGDEVGGHFVQGHVDAVGEVIAVTGDDASHLAVIRAPKDLMKFVARTGSITLNGVSMTVAEHSEDSLTVGIIPHTWNVTNLSEFHRGARVNLEMDMLAKYLERLVASNTIGANHVPKTA